MKFTKLALSLLCCTVLFCGCTKDNSAAIKVNDKIITKAEFYDDYKKIKKVQLANAPKEIQKDTSYTSLSIKNNQVKDAIARELLNQEFEKRKITASEEEIKEQTQKVINRIGSIEVFTNLMKENGITQERLNSDMANEVKVEKLYRALSKKKITDADAEKFYKENKESFERPERVQAFHILIKTRKEEHKLAIAAADKEGKLSQSQIDKKADEEVTKAKALVTEIRQKALNNPKNFSQLAKEYSQDIGSAQKGGDLGYVTKEQLVPAFGEALFKLKVGEISTPVETQFGTHIILAKDKVKAGIQPFSEVKAELKKFLENKDKYETMEKLMNGLKSSAKIEYIDESLNPKNLEKAMEEALPKQLDFEQKMYAPKSKTKILDKIKKQKEEK